MSTKNLELDVQSRLESGKGASRRLRRQGLVPAILYGRKTEPTSISVKLLEIRRILKNENENALITLKGDAKGAGKKVLIKDWDKDIMTREPLHVDFYEVDLTKTVRVFVPLEFTGKAKGLAEGGLVEPIVRQIEIECLPVDIPQKVLVDVSALGIGDSVHIEDLQLDSKIKKIFHDNYTLVTCTYIKEEVIAAVAADPTAAAAEPEVMAKGKKDEEGAPAAGGDKKAAPAAGGEKKAEAKK